MRILFVADGRSPTTRRWLKGIAALGHEVHLISTYPCRRIEGVASLHVLPVAFGSLGGAGQKKESKAASSLPSRHNVVKGILRWFIVRYRLVFQFIRYYLGPLSLRWYTSEFNRLVAEIRPDVVHALRIPFEGMLCAGLPAGVPLVISTWGNDLTLHARGSLWMRRLTAAALARSQGLLADSARDLRLAYELGLPPGTPGKVIPGAGGIDLDEINASRDDSVGLIGGFIEAGNPLVVNPRGIRPAYVRNDVFFRAIPLVLEVVPQARFVCPAMAGELEVERWVARYRIGAQVRLLPPLSQPRLWAIYHHSQVLVSPSIHDGTPNSVLEGMACGCFPVAGDIESLREWIESGKNGLLVDPTDPASVAAGIIRALKDEALRKRAASLNRRLVAERAEYGQVMKVVGEFYRQVAKG